MTWEIFAIISIVTTSIAAQFGRVLMKEDLSNPISFAILFQFLLGIVTWCFALSFGKFILPYDSSMWFRYLLSALLWAGAMVASLKAMKLLQIGEVAIIGTSSAFVTISLGVLIFSERLTIPSIIGIILIFLAIWIIFSENLVFKSKSGMVFAFLSALGGGTAVINDMIILRTYEAFSYTTIMSFLPGLVLLLIFPKHLIKYRSLFNRKTLKIMILMAVFYSIQAITYYLAIEQKAPISKLSPITKSSIILTVILAAIFLKERSQISKKIIAAFVVTVGAILAG